MFLSFRGAPLRANPESISPTPRWIPGSRNARPGMTADSIAQMAATFRDGDTHPRVLKRAYVRHVLVVRGASRGRFEAEQDAAPARVSRKHAPGRLGSPSGPTMWLCRSPAGRGADEGGESRPDQGSSNLPRPHPEVRSPRPKSPQWSAARRCAFGRPSLRTRCRKRNDTQVRLAALHAPRCPGQLTDQLAQCARANAHAFRWREWSKPHAHAV